MSETPGERLFDIRAACGGGPRAPMPMKEFVALVKERTGVAYHANTISLLEQNKQGWRLSDVRTLAAADPLSRGEIWLSALHGPGARVERADIAAPRGSSTVPKGLRRDEDDEQGA